MIKTIQAHARLVAALADVLEDVLTGNNGDLRIELDALTSLLVRRLAFLRQRALDGVVSTESITASIDQTILYLETLRDSQTPAETLRLLSDFSDGNPPKQPS